MIVATIASPHPTSVLEKIDGEVVVVHPDRTHAARLPERYRTSLLRLLDDWNSAISLLSKIDRSIRSGNHLDLIDLSKHTIKAPLPRTWGLLDGSAYIQHILLVRKARGAEPPPDLYTIPLMYQALSDNLLGPIDSVPLIDQSHGMDFEAELVVITDHVPCGTKASEAGKHIKLMMLMNDVSLRNLIPRELETGFGFFHGKPPSTFSPFAVTLDELGDSWREGRVHLPIVSTLNGKEVGRPDAGEMHFSFFQLIEHAAKTRPLSAGTIIGSGTVSNKDQSRGVSCLAEKRMLEKISGGEIVTPFMRVGDRIQIEVVKDGVSLFGGICNEVVKG